MGQNKPSTTALPAPIRLVCALLEVACRAIGRGGAFIGKWWGRRWLSLADRFHAAARA